MKASKVITIAVASGLLGSSLIATPALAWHPNGTIKKYVQNKTTNTALSDANDASGSIAAKPGDILKYVIEVKNTAAAASNSYNDLYFTKLTDTLPAGVELISNPSQRTLTEDLGILKPGQSVTKEYLVKVTSTKDADIIQNKACFTGDSKVKDNPQSGCDTATIEVSMPPAAPVPATPTPAPTPVPVPAPSTPVELPKTGSSAMLAFVAALSVGIVGYGFNLTLLKHRRSE